MSTDALESLADAAFAAVCLSHSAEPSADVPRVAFTGPVRWRGILTDVDCRSAFERLVEEARVMFKRMVGFDVGERPAVLLAGVGSWGELVAVELFLSDPSGNVRLELFLPFYWDLEENRPSLPKHASLQMRVAYQAVCTLHSNFTRALRSSTFGRISAALRIGGPLHVVKVSGLGSLYNCGVEMARRCTHVLGFSHTKSLTAFAKPSACSVVWNTARFLGARDMRYIVMQPLERRARKSTRRRYCPSQTLLRPPPLPPPAPPLLLHSAHPSRRV